MLSVENCIQASMVKSICYTVELNDNLFSFLFFLKLEVCTNIKYHWKLQDSGFVLISVYPRPCLQITSTWNASCDIATSRVSNMVWMYVPHQVNLISWLPLYYIHASQRWEPIFIHRRSGEVGKLFLFQFTSWNFTYWSRERDLVSGLLQRHSWGSATVNVLGNMNPLAGW